MCPRMRVIFSHNSYCMVFAGTIYLRFVLTVKTSSAVACVTVRDLLWLEAQTKDSGVKRSDLVWRRKNSVEVLVSLTYYCETLRDRTTSYS